MPTAAVPADILNAITVIRDTVFDIRRHDEHVIATSHTLLARRRRDLSPGDLVDAIDHYLDDETWHQGAHVLLRAVHHIALRAGIPDHSHDLIAVQPPLFDL